MKLWKPSEFKVRTIEDKEMDILRSDGPVLSAFRGSRLENPFMRIKPKWPESSRQPEEVVLRNNELSNLRAYYFLLLSSCFQARGEQRARTLLSNLKKFLYAESTLLDEFGRQYSEHSVPPGHPPPDGQHARVLSSNPAMKRLLTEFLQLLSHQLDLCSLLSSYPIIDAILLAVIQAVVLTHHYSPERSRLGVKIPTEIIVSSLKLQFGVRIEVMPDGEVVF